jgi:hypothetical protein
MKAIVRHTYGSPDVFRLEEVPKPTAGESDVLARVHGPGSLDVVRSIGADHVLDYTGTISLIADSDTT